MKYVTQNMTRFLLAMSFSFLSFNSGASFQQGGGDKDARLVSDILSYATGYVITPEGDIQRVEALPSDSLVRDYSMIEGGLRSGQDVACQNIGLEPKDYYEDSHVSSSIFRKGEKIAQDVLKDKLAVCAQQVINERGVNWQVQDLQGDLSNSGLRGKLDCLQNKWSETFKIQPGYQAIIKKSHKNAVDHLDSSRQYISFVDFAVVGWKRQSSIVKKPFSLVSSALWGLASIEIPHLFRKKSVQMIGCGLGLGLLARRYVPKQYQWRAVAGSGLGFFALQRLKESFDDRSLYTQKKDKADKRCQKLLEEGRQLECGFSYKDLRDALVNALRDKRVVRIDENAQKAAEQSYQAVSTLQDVRVDQEKHSEALGRIQGEQKEQSEQLASLQGGQESIQAQVSDLSERLTSIAKELGIKFENAEKGMKAHVDKAADTIIGRLQAATRTIVQEELQKGFAEQKQEFNLLKEALLDQKSMTPENVAELTQRVQQLEQKVAVEKSKRTLDEEKVVTGEVPLPSSCEEEGDDIQEGDGFSPSGDVVVDNLQCGQKREHRAHDETTVYCVMQPDYSDVFTDLKNKSVASCATDKSKCKGRKQSKDFAIIEQVGDDVEGTCLDIGQSKWFKTYIAHVAQADVMKKCAYSLATSVVMHAAAQQLVKKTLPQSWFTMQKSFAQGLAKSKGFLARIMQVKS